MDVFARGLLIIGGVCALLGVIAVPLMLRKVPPNVVYGYRTRATLSNERIWYEANAHFGRGLFIACIVSVVLMLVFYKTRAFGPELFMPASAGVMALPPLIAAMATARYIRTLR